MRASRARQAVFKLLVPLYLSFIPGIPLLVCVVPLLTLSAPALRMGVLLVSPILYTLVYVVVAGLLSLPHQDAIVAGRFPRQLGHPIYFHRRLYGLCWTAVFYFKPVFFLALSFPLFKIIMFRLFGYRGSMDFTTYPDTWIRDLPLLDLGKGAYLSNRATIGTNIALPDGTILVDKVKVGNGALVGHLCMLAPGAEIGDNSEVGAGCGIGLRTVVEEGVKIGPYCYIEHGVRIRAKARIGAWTYVRGGARIDERQSFSSGIVVPRKRRLSEERAATGAVPDFADALPAVAFETL